jgi:hypothetical protein
MKAVNDLVGFVNLTHPHDTLTRRLRQSFKARATSPTSRVRAPDVVLLVEQYAR